MRDSPYFFIKGLGDAATLGAQLAQTIFLHFVLYEPCRIKFESILHSYGALGDYRSTDT